MPSCGGNFPFSKSQVDNVPGKTPSLLPGHHRSNSRDLPCFSGTAAAQFAETRERFDAHQVSSRRTNITKPFNPRIYGRYSRHAPFAVPDKA
jgi:hypothetical protein